jgi:hypothetical protein
MKSLNIITTLIILIMATKTSAQKSTKNLLHQYSEGSEVVFASSNQGGGGYGSENLLSSYETENQPYNGNDTSWWTDQGAPFPHSAILKTAGNGGTISKLVISNFSPEDEEGGGYRGIPAKDITIEASTQGADKGFKKVGDFKLKRNTKKQSFSVTPTQAKWIRITIKSNYGNEEYTILGGIEAY